MSPGTRTHSLVMIVNSSRSLGPNIDFYVVCGFSRARQIVAYKIQFNKEATAWDLRSGRGDQQCFDVKTEGDHGEVPSIKTSLPIPPRRMPCVVPPPLRLHTKNLEW